MIICVPTPLRKSKDPDISFVTAAAQEAAAHFRPAQLVILESTTYPGTTQELLAPMFEARGARPGVDCFLAFSPERIDPANPTFAVKDIPKVVGGLTPECASLTALLYRQIVGRVVTVSSPRVAELAKLYENVFRNVNIALANELAVMCRQLGVSTREVIDAAATKPFGFMPFYPGPGIGGHCIGVDPAYLAWRMRLNGYEARFIHLADEINRAMPQFVVDVVTESLNGRRRCLNGAHILALGIAYKRGVGDTRESPALEVIARLMDRGAKVDYADPYVAEIAFEGRALKAVEASDERLAEADCAVVLTDHAAFDYARVVAGPTPVADSRRPPPQQLRFARHLRRRRIQIMDRYNFYPNVFAIPAARLARTPVVLASIRDTGAQLTPRQRRVQRLACRLADHILVNAEAVRQWLTAEGYDPTRISVIRNGLDLSRFTPGAHDTPLRRELGVPDRAPLVAMLSRLSRLKGVEDFLDAAATVAQRFGEAHFLVIGDNIDPDGSRYRSELESRAARLGLQKRVIFTGFRPDGPRRLSAVSVPGLPPLSEGLSNT